MVRCLVAKVGTSNPDRTISLKRLQCAVENKLTKENVGGGVQFLCEHWPKTFFFTSQRVELGPLSFVTSDFIDSSFN
jgi:hypothetical protein